MSKRYFRVVPFFATLLSIFKKPLCAVVSIAVLCSTGVLYAQSSSSLSSVQVINVPEKQGKGITKAQEEIGAETTLDQCIAFALRSYPALQQSYLDEKITRSQVYDKLAVWYPNLDFFADYQHTLQRRTSFVGGNAVVFGPTNNTDYYVAFKQNLFSADGVLALRTRAKTREQAKESVQAQRINVIVNVSKAFYDVLRTTKQIDVFEEDIIRLQRSLLDAKNRYESGVVDNIDMKRASIALNNTRAQYKQASELLKAKYAILKQYMGLDNARYLHLAYDSLAMEKEAFIDLTQQVRISDRVEYRQLQIQKTLMQENARYQKLNHLPQLSLTGQYQLIYQETNNNLKRMFDNTVQYSFLALQFNLPIFQGFTKHRATRQAEWRLQRTEEDIRQIKSTINSEYEQAVANYRADLSNYLLLRENMVLATEVYATISDQYKAGIKTYLDVITAETDLRSARLNYTDALFQLLSTKIDVERAQGAIK